MIERPYTQRDLQKKITKAKHKLNIDKSIYFTALTFSLGMISIAAISHTNMNYWKISFLIFMGILILAIAKMIIHSISDDYRKSIHSLKQLTIDEDPFSFNVLSELGEAHRELNSLVEGFRRSEVGFLIMDVDITKKKLKELFLAGEDIRYPMEMEDEIPSGGLNFPDGMF